MLDATFDPDTKLVTVLASGHVTHEDYEAVMIPTVENAAAGGGKIRLLYILGPEFEGFGAHAMWDDTKLGMRHFSDFEKVAAVTDNILIQNAVRAFGMLMPAEVRAFDLADREAAEAWVIA
ncbi:MAG: STAS/SEC14 domain-containing protein [Pseudomonadota bacterium]